MIRKIIRLVLNIKTDNYIYQSQDIKNLRWIVLGNGGFANTIRGYLSLKSNWDDVSIFFRNRIHDSAPVSEYFSNSVNFYKILDPRVKLYDSWTIIPNFQSDQQEFAKTYNNLNKLGLYVNIECSKNFVSLRSAYRKIYETELNLQELKS